MHGSASHRGWKPLLHESIRRRYATKQGRSCGEMLRGNEADRREPFPGGSPRTNGRIARVDLTVSDVAIAAGSRSYGRGRELSGGGDRCGCRSRQRGQGPLPRGRPRYTVCMTADLSVYVPGPPLRDAIVGLMPRLAAFDLPPRRHPPDLWRGDAQMLDRWFAGKAPDVHVFCAGPGTDIVAGMAMYSLRTELLSGEPSAHLEALAVAVGHEGRGIGTRLLDACQADARERGARSMTLHVFDTNRRALDLYRRHGYEPELRRCIKWF